MNKEVCLEVRKLSFAYPVSKRFTSPQPALQDVSFDIFRGEIFGLLGPNGSGKTTLFNIISTLLRRGSGSAQVFGIDVASQPSVIRRRIGVAFQSPSLDKWLTLRENLLHHGHLYGLHGSHLKDRIRKALDSFGLLERANNSVASLSGGLMRRLELAKTMLHMPDLLLLDEPGTGLDPGVRNELWDQIEGLAESHGISVLLSTHLMEEAERCDRIALLHAGKLVTCGTPNELKQTIGGDIITVGTKSPDKLRAQVEEQFGLAVSVAEGKLRIELEAGHNFIPRLFNSFPGQIETVSLNKPTLEDVFIHHTGHGLAEDSSRWDGTHTGTQKRPGTERLVQ